MGKEYLTLQRPKKIVFISAADFCTLNFSIRIPPVAMTVAFGHRKASFYRLAVVCTFCIAVRNISPTQKPSLAGLSGLFKGGFVRIMGQYPSWHCSDF